MNAKYIKTKRNPKLKHKYFSPYEILEVMGKQANKLILPSKWHIYPVFHVLLSKGDVIRREAIDQKIVNQFKFEERKQSEQKVDSIMDSMVFAKQVIDG